MSCRQRHVPVMASRQAKRCHHQLGTIRATGQTSFRRPGSPVRLASRITREAMQRQTALSRIRQQGRIVRQLRALILCLLLVQIVGLPQVEARDTAASLGPVDPYADVLPGALARISRAAEDLSAYRMEVSLDPEASTIAGELELSWRNPA